MGFALGVVVYGCWLTVLELQSTLGSQDKTMAVGMGLLVVLVGLLLLSASIFAAYLVEAFFRGYLFMRERNTRTKSLPITVLN